MQLLQVEEEKLKLELKVKNNENQERKNQQKHERILHIVGATCCLCIEFDCVLSVCVFLVSLYVLLLAAGPSETWLKLIEATTEMCQTAGDVDEGKDTIQDRIHNKTENTYTYKRNNETWKQRNEKHGKQQEQLTTSKQDLHPLKTIECSKLSIVYFLFSFFCF